MLLRCSCWGAVGVLCVFLGLTGGLVWVGRWAAAEVGWTGAEGLGGIRPEGGEGWVGSL